MKLIERHQFGGILNSLKQFLNPKYSIDEVPTGPTPPRGNWSKLPMLEPDVSVAPKIKQKELNISSSEQPDALSVNNNIVAPIPKSIFTPYNKFLYDAIFTDANGKPYEYKEVNTNTFNKRFLSPQEASDFQDNKRNQWKQNDFRYALRNKISKHQDGGQFQEDLTPPSRGLFGEIGTNLQQGNEMFGRIVGSTPVQLLLTGITSGIGGMFGPTMKVSKTAKELVTNPRNAIRKFSRNLNARKGDPTYRWTKTSGNLREGGAYDYQFPGMGSGTRMKINSAARSEGSGYSAQPTLNANPTYQRASAPAQTPMQRTWNHQRSVPVEWQASRRVMQRNNLIDQARDWRNYIFESPRFGGANFKVIPK